MINLYGAKEQDMTFLEKNGDIVITPMKAVLHKYENGDYYIDLEVSTDYLDYITQDRIIKADMPWNDYEIFRISNISVDHNRIKCKCWHISYDFKCYSCLTANYPVVQFRNAENVNQKLYNCLYYTGHYEQNPPSCSLKRITPEDFYTAGNFVNFNKDQIYWAPKDYSVGGKYKSLYDVVEEVRKFYDAFVYRKKLEVYLLPVRTTYDSEITIEYGKNLKELTKTENWDNLVGIINEHYPDDGNLMQYTCPDEYFFPPQGMTKGDYERGVSFQSSIDSSAYNSKTEYINAVMAEKAQQAQDYFQKYGKPIVNYNFKGNIDGNIDLGAIIMVRDLQIGANIETVVVGFQYDLISQRYVEVSFGSNTESIKGYNIQVNEKIIRAEKNSPLLSYPIGSIYVSSNSSMPDMGGFWELQSSSGGLYTWKRTA